MGSEANCKMTIGRASFQGKAHLDQDQLLFRGEKRLAIPLATIQSVVAEGGNLKIKCPEGMVTFDLGPHAEKWADKILHPKSLLDKLGVKPDSKVALLELTDEAFRRQLRERVAHFDDGLQTKDYDLIFVGVKGQPDLKAFPALAKKLKQTGAIWTIRPKGGELTDVHVINAAKSSGLVDVKVVSFSATHSAEKLMIPVSRRK